MYEVLIVEDDPMVAMINRQYIGQNKHFHVCCSCRDGFSAFEYLMNNPVHLAILDVYMPRLDGMSLLRKIRENNLPVSVIMVTAASDSGVLEEALRLGVVDYLVKPFMNERFQQALDSFVSRQAAFHDIPSFSQQSIDSLIGISSVKSICELPKGIQSATLDTICKFMKDNPNTEFTGEEIADRIGLSRVTVKRYMNYLCEKGDISGFMNYETGGRPCMLYRIDK